MTSGRKSEASSGESYIVGLDGAYAIAAVEGIVYTPEMRRILEEEAAALQRKKQSGTGPVTVPA
jgi:hypothetical protein